MRPRAASALAAEGPPAPEKAALVAVPAAPPVMAARATDQVRSGQGSARARASALQSRSPANWSAAIVRRARRARGRVTPCPTREARAPRLAAHQQGGRPVAHGDVLPPGTVVNGPRGPLDVCLEMHHFFGWVPVGVVAEATGVGTDIIEEMAASHPTLFAARLGPGVLARALDKPEGRATWADRAAAGAALRPAVAAAGQYRLAHSPVRKLGSVSQRRGGGH